MPWPAYTETFIRMTAQGVWTRYTVPAGHRAVVTSILAQNFATAGGLANVEIGGVYLLSTPVLASGQSYTLALRAVAYSGQQISGLTQAQTVHLTVSGYLFREASLLQGRAPRTEEEPAAPGFVAPGESPSPVEGRVLPGPVAVA